jgi:excinuclease ABC subunit A
MDHIKIVGACEHNLKNISVNIPRDKLVVITGLSGSGKSSLAFDTIYAEGQRRYVESLSAYARQFLGIMEKPEVEYIEGLSPAISIDQKSSSKNPRSTVGTVTEIYDYLRLLFARIGRPHCPNGHGEIAKMSPAEIIRRVKNLPYKKIIILAPIIKDKKGQHQHIFDEIKKAGFVRARVDGRIFEIPEALNLNLARFKTHSIDVAVDRLSLNKDLEEKRLINSIETALNLGDGVVIIQDAESLHETIFSEHFSCSVCGFSFTEIQPRIFSFNSPHGACPDCQGLGIKLEIDPDLIIPNKNLTLAEGAIRPWARANASSRWYYKLLSAVAQAHKFSMNKSISDLSSKALDIILYGTGDALYDLSGGLGKIRQYVTTYEGVIPNLTRRYKETDSDFIRGEIERYMIEKRCETCQGARLKSDILYITIQGQSIVDIARMDIAQEIKFFNSLPQKLKSDENIIGRQIIKEIKKRLLFLNNVGLSYLTVDRAAATLAGGEAQRIRLATQISSGLQGVLYILDEPSIGLHQRDHRKLLATLKSLRDLGNTVIVVEHDETTMREADHIIDIGPGAGDHGGEVIFEGTPKQLIRSSKSITGEYLAGKKKIEIPLKRKSAKKFLEVRGAAEFNLKDIDVKIPLGIFVSITGVSGSGKSTLVNEILAKALSKKFYNSHAEPGKHKKILGTENLDKVINIDQSPIGRTPRSNPATYTGVFTIIRDLFASTPEARLRGYKAGRFSFNVRGGRCEACRGEGMIKIEMNFLPDVYVTCQECKGKRYNHEALEIHYKGKTIADILDMTVEEALQFFKNIPALSGKLQILEDVGLGYIHLGQPATTLSGGEAQRIKLATELARKSTGQTLYILDEPTTGLHFDDTKRLLQVLHRLAEMGNSVLVIEHNLDVVKSADWIIDLGPEGGEKGGRVVVQGTPEKVALSKTSYTGKYLKDILARK